ncbi:uncharacterized protein BYT42DRAFT_584726 [Radiomyces spectabilis]|uniref:uncharacterized protein n=1 Tax=Radiomyces spectabilis TaxID=64574 RepID=UPI00221F9565|nr:uncharacterized protein BYT42DRAFT_584726 [Radiomyces spectabilis]KAI8369512.1 hypothetical protein BYT42DRAFT_584726 [Radiomyces spectabilis]
MKYLAAYLLLNVGGKANPSAEDIKSLFKSVGIEAEEERLSSLISALGEKDIAQVKSRHNGSIFPIAEMQFTDLSLRVLAH